MARGRSHISIEAVCSWLKQALCEQVSLIHSVCTGPAIREPARSRELFLANQNAQLKSTHTFMRFDWLIGAYVRHKRGVCSRLHELARLFETSATFSPVQ